MFRWLQRRAAAPPSSSEPFRFKYGELETRVLVYPHDAPVADNRTAPAWIFVSDGLAEEGQREIVFTHIRRRGESSTRPPTDALEYMAMVHKFAKEGRIAGPGHTTQFAQNGRLLGWSAILYAECPDFPIDEAPSDALIALGLHEPELAALHEGGPTRILAGLGRATRFYPFPYWSDINRPLLPFARPGVTSGLSEIVRLRASGCYTSLSPADNHVTLRLDANWRRRMAAPFSDELPPNTPIALLTDRDPTSTACQVWQPGSTNPQAIAAGDQAGERICGCFIAFVPDQATNTIHINEDGYVVLLTSDDWARVRAALLEEAGSIGLPPTADGWRFSLW